MQSSGLVGTADPTISRKSDQANKRLGSATEFLDKMMGNLDEKVNKRRVLAFDDTEKNQKFKKIMDMQSGVANALQKNSMPNAPELGFKGKDMIMKV